MKEEDATRQVAKPDLETLAGSLAGAMPSLSPEDQHLALAIYRRLAEAEPVSIGAVATDLGSTERDVEATLTRWPGVYRDGDGRIVGFWGLAIPEMPHRFSVAGRTLHTWCAWDALFIPELIERPAEVESRSPASGEPVRLRVSPRGVEDLSPPSIVVSMLVPSATLDHDMILSFCHFVHFFPTAEDADPWIADHPETFLLSVGEAFELGRLTNRAKFGLALGTS